MAKPGDLFGEKGAGGGKRNINGPTPLRTGLAIARADVEVNTRMLTTAMALELFDGRAGNLH